MQIIGQNELHSTDTILITRWEHIRSSKKTYRSHVSFTVSGNVKMGDASASICILRLISLCNVACLKIKFAIVKRLPHSAIRYQSISLSPILKMQFFHNRSGKKITSASLSMRYAHKPIVTVICELHDFRTFLSKFLFYTFRNKTWTYMRNTLQFTFYAK